MPVATHPPADAGQIRLERPAKGPVPVIGSATQASEVAETVPVRTAGPVAVVPMATHLPVPGGQTTWESEVTAAPETVGTVSAVKAVLVVGEERMVAPPLP